MSIFSSILNKILPGRANAAEAPAAPAAGQPAGGDASTAPAAGGAAPAAPGAAAAPAATVDVAALLNDLASKASQPLNWKTSIVDLMKLLDLDSSLSARKELAKELNYTGDTNDSATMNIWLHKQVMVKLAANGGKVPDDLKN